MKVADQIISPFAFFLSLNGELDFWNWKFGMGDYIPFRLFVVE
jgi:hypothetical protein